MAGKRLPSHLRENIGGPSTSTIVRHLRKVRNAVAPGSPGVASNMQAIREIWEPIILARRHDNHNSTDMMDELPGDESDTDEDDDDRDDTHMDDLWGDESCTDEDDDDTDEDDDGNHGEAKSDDTQIIMVEMSEDESGICGLIEYWRDEDSIYGSCGWKSPTHKCNDHFHPVIGSSWDRLVQIMSKAVVASYLRVIMINPLVDWLPPMTCHINATCNKFDHHPQVTSQWCNTLNHFNRILRPLGCNHTGRGSDGDGRRFKLQYELCMLALEELTRQRHAAIVLQSVWRRVPSIAWVVTQILRRRALTRRPWVTVPTPVIRLKTTFTLPISLEGASGFTFAVCVHMLSLL